MLIASAIFMVAAGIYQHNEDSLMQIICACCAGSCLGISIMEVLNVVN